MKVFRALSVFLVLPAGLTLTSPAVAQESAFTLEEIVVTARKRVESIQDTPVAITAFNEDDLAVISSSDISTLGNFTPNLNLAFSQGNSGGSNLGANIRGVGQSDHLITTDPGVGVYIDGVYLGRTSGSVLDLLNVERIEVLRGPQGTIFGKNTIGGAINVVTSAPPEEFEGRAKLTVGADSRMDAQISVGGKLSETLSGQLSLATNNRDGYVSRPLDGTDLGDIDQLVGRASLNWQVSEDVTFDLAFDASRQRQSSSPSLLSAVNPGGSIIGLYNGFVSPGDPITPDDAVMANADFSVTQQTGPNRNDVDVYGISLAVEWEMNDDLTFRSITSYRDLEAVYGRDGDNLPLTYVETLDFVDQDQFSQEFQLLGNAMDGNLEWLAGLYHFNENASDFNRPRLASGLYDALEALPTSLDCLLAPPGAIPTCPAQSPGVPGGAGNPVNVALDLNLNVLTAQDVTSNALFFNMAYALSDALTLSLGARYTDEEKEFVISSFREGSGVVIFAPGTTAVDSWQEVSYRVGLDFKPSDNTLVYGSVSRGFRSGGFNGRPTTAGALGSYDPELMTTYEVGFKGDLLEDRLRFNTAIFSSDYEDIQLLSRSLDPNSGTFISLNQNAAEASIEGLELEMTALLSEQLTLQVGLGYLDTSYDDIGNAVGIDASFELFQSPEKSGNIALSHSLSLSSGASWVSRVDYFYTDSFFFEAINLAATQSDSYGLLGLRGTYTPVSGQYEVSLFVSNATDEEFFVSGGSALDSFGTAEITPARGREWGVSVLYNF